MDATAAALNGSPVWIYHERQEALLCGQHALNNLVQRPIFEFHQLAAIAQELDQLERRVLTAPGELVRASSNVDDRGNFSIQVIQTALMQYYGITLPHIHTTRHQDAATMQGFICHRHDHWFCIRNIAGRFWDLNSTRALAEPISHFKIATSMDAWTKEGYTIFAVQGGLPSVGQKPGGETKAASDGNWHLMSDLLKGNATAKDPFTDLVGRGMRLDGGGGAANSENEMDDLQRALQASLRESVPLPPVPPEPPANAAGSVRLQLKLPNGERLVRRFLESDSVLAVYAVVKDMSPNAGALNLRVGFPPRDMSHLQGLTIGQAGLKGESIQGRYV